MNPENPVGTVADTPTERFRRARDYLLGVRNDYIRAYREFSWPVFTEFNWALDWFDVIARDNPRPALWIVEEDG
jgi:acetyl-CoA synthetase